jgi:probable phosphoglycerate mutase
MTHFYFIRHGEPIGYQDGRAIGINPGLSPLGVTQAERLRDRLAATREIRADALISSPLPRAKETAEMLAPALDLPVIIEDEVQEFNLGEKEALTDEEIQALGSGFDLQQEPFRQVAPSGDSWAGFVMRIWRALDRLTRLYEGKTVIILCHGGVIEAGFLYFLGLSPLRRLHIGSPPTGITHGARDIFYGQSEKPEWRAGQLQRPGTSARQRTGAGNWLESPLSNQGKGNTA